MWTLHPRSPFTKENNIVTVSFIDPQMNEIYLFGDEMIEEGIYNISLPKNSMRIDVYVRLYLIYERC